MTLTNMSEPAKLVTDGVLGGLGVVAFFIQGVTLLTALGGLLLIGLRIAIGWQEYRLNRVKLVVSEVEVAHDPGL